MNGLVDEERSLEDKTERQAEEEGAKWQLNRSVI